MKVTMRNNVEQDFFEAYQRLSAGAPVHPKLRARLAAGRKVSVNQSTVALEAGHSRTLLSQRARGYERICGLLFPEERSDADRIFGDAHSSERTKKAESAQEKLARLNAIIAGLASERDLFATRAAEAYQSIALLKSEIKLLRAEIDRRCQRRNDWQGSHGGDAAGGEPK